MTTDTNNTKKAPAKNGGKDKANTKTPAPTKNGKARDTKKVAK